MSLSVGLSMIAGRLLEWHVGSQNRWHARPAVTEMKSCRCCVSNFAKVATNSQRELQVKLSASFASPSRLLESESHEQPLSRPDSHMDHVLRGSNLQLSELRGSGLCGGIDSSRELAWYCLVLGALMWLLLIGRLFKNQLDDKGAESKVLRQSQE